MELEGSYEERYQRALEAIDPSNPDDAIAQFRRLFERLANLPPDLREKGAGLNQILVASGDRLVTLLRWKGDFAGSQQALDRLEELAPVFKQSWDVERALTYIDSGEPEKGLDLLRGQMMQRSQDPTIRIILGQELMQQGQTAEAERVLRRVAQDKGHKDAALEANLLLVNLLLKMDRPEDAVAAWNKAAALEPGARDAAPMVYDWLLRHGRLDLLESVLQSDGNSFRANLYLGRSAAARGDADEAKRRWEKVIEQKPDKEGWGAVQSWIEALLHLGRLDEALGLLSAALTNNLGGTRSMVLTSIGLVLKGHADRTPDGLAIAAGSQVQFRPRRKTLPAEDWWLVELYVHDPAALAILRPYFDVPQETAQPAPAPEPAVAAEMPAAQPPEAGGAAGDSPPVA